MDNKITLTPEFFENLWQTSLSPFISNKVQEYNMSYVDISESERDDALINIMSFLLSDFVVFAGEHRFNDWDEGWGENLTQFEKTKTIESLIPHYFGKHQLNRLNQRFIKPTDIQFEVKILSILQYWIFEKYMKESAVIYEFGCGTGHNLLRLREINSTAELWGMDWTPSSQKLLKGVAALVDPKLHSHQFDYYIPDYNFNLSKNGSIFTFASLEQTGSDYIKFIDYLLFNKPKLCIHIEPTGETLDNRSLLDYLSIEYFKKRNYLNGFVNYLKDLERDKKVEIIEIRRSFIGSFYIDGYSIIVWRPL